MAEFFFSKYFCWEALFLQDHLTLLGPLFKIFWLTVHHPRRPRGSQSGREKRRDEIFQVRAKEPLGTDSHRTISKNSSRWWLLIGHKKCFLLLCPIGEQFLLQRVLFVSWYTTAIVSITACLILGDPGAVSRVGRGEAGRKFSSTGERAPGYRLSPNYLQKFKQMPAPDWAQKMLCIIVPNRWTVSPEFFSWVRTRRLLSCHTCPVRSPSLCEQGKLLFSIFLTQNEGTTDKSKKRLGYYQQEQFNLPREYSVFYSSQCIVNNRNIKMRRRRGIQIKNSLTRQNNIFARASHFFVHFFALHCTTTREIA